MARRRRRRACATDAGEPGCSPTARWASAACPRRRCSRGPAAGSPVTTRVTALTGPVPDRLRLPLSPGDRRPLRRAGGQKAEAAGVGSRLRGDRRRPAAAHRRPHGPRGGALAHRAGQGGDPAPARARIPRRDERRHHRRQHQRGRAVRRQRPRRARRSSVCCSTPWRRWRRTGRARKLSRPTGRSAGGALDPRGRCPDARPGGRAGPPAGRRSRHAGAALRADAEADFR